MTAAREVLAAYFSRHTTATDTQFIAADAIIAALTDAGLVIVPKEPTDAMYRAFYDTDSLAGTGTRNRFNKGWRAMVEAAQELKEHKTP